MVHTHPPKGGFISHLTPAQLALGWAVFFDKPTGADTRQAILNDHTYTEEQRDALVYLHDLFDGDQ